MIDELRRDPRCTARMSTAVPDGLMRTAAEGEEGVMPVVPLVPAVAPAKKKPKAKIVFAALALVLGAAGTTAWFMGRSKESTDDAFIEGHVASVASRIQGQVVNVNVNQLVEVGTFSPRRRASSLPRRSSRCRARSSGGPSRNRGQRGLAAP